MLINAIFIFLFLLEEDTQQQEWCLKVKEGIKRGQKRKITSGEWMLGSRGGAYLTLENQNVESKCIRYKWIDLIIKRQQLYFPNQS